MGSSAGGRFGLLDAYFDVGRIRGERTFPERLYPRTRFLYRGETIDYRLERSLIPSGERCRERWRVDIPDQLGASSRVKSSGLSARETSAALPRCATRSGAALKVIPAASASALTLSATTRAKMSAGNTGNSTCARSWIRSPPSRFNGIRQGLIGHAQKAGKGDRRIISTRTYRGARLFVESGANIGARAVERARCRAGAVALRTRPASRRSIARRLLYT